MWRLYPITEHIFRFINGRIYRSEYNLLQNEFEVSELIVSVVIFLFQIHFKSRTANLNIQMCAELLLIFHKFRFEPNGLKSIL
jgi:hypothetical protein